MAAAPVSHVAARGFWFLLVLCIPTNSSATILLTACSNDGVVLAADGLSLQPAIHGFFGSCKIVQGASDCFFAISGMQDKKSIHYDLVPIARRACRGNGSLFDRSQVFQKMALPEIRRAWRDMKANDPNTYAFIEGKGPNRIDVVFVGGPPFTVAIVQFVEDERGNMIPEKPILDVGHYGGAPMRELVGSNNGLIYLRRHPEIDHLGDVQFVRALLLGAIDVEREKTTPVHEIGQPVAILKLDVNGASWVEQGRCEAIRTTQHKPKTRQK
jgi:hypothetical protein